MKRGAMILCGGRSTRMGRDKASLPFGPETMLQRVVRLLGQVVEVDRIVVVAAVDQSLPPLPHGVEIARDAFPQRGPLEALAAGMRVAFRRADAVYATSCDVPLLVPAFVDKVFGSLGENAIAVPRDGEHHHPLAAVYRTSVLAHVERLLQSDRLRPRFLFDEVATREIPVEKLREVDPHLSTLENLNRPEDYVRALTSAGFPATNEP